MTRRSSLLFAAVPLLLAAFSAPAAAQLTVAGLAWEAPAADVRTRLERLGWRYVGTDQDGDQVYAGPRGSEAVATLASGRLVGMDLRWPVATVAASRVRYRAATDSLRRLYRAPTTVDEESTAWSADSVLLYTWISQGSGAHPGPGAGITAWGRGYDAEMTRRSEAERVERHRIETGQQRPDSLLSGDWTIVYSDARVLTRLDSATFRAAGPDRFHARLREDWMFTRRLSNGMKYNATVRDVEIDCRAVRARVLRTVAGFALHAVPGTAAGTVSAWGAPAPQSPEARAIRRSCEMMRPSRA
jgi:hypothetical protein